MWKGSNIKTNRIGIRFFSFFFFLKSIGTLAEEMLHWEHRNRWDQRERMKRISLDTADEKRTWINDEEKKTTTSTALAVSRFHLDGASHLQEREERATERLALATRAVVATTRGHKPEVSRVPWLERKPKHLHATKLTWHCCDSAASYSVYTKQVSSLSHIK